VWWLKGTEDVQEVTLGVYDHPCSPDSPWLDCAPIARTRASRAARWITSRTLEINQLRKYVP
jgi:hypothetical protein